MDVSSVNSGSTNIQTNTTGAQAAGVSAPQTETQRADVAATRVVENRESAKLEEFAQNVEQRTFEAIKDKAAKFSRGENPFLNNISFTIYNQSSNNNLGKFEIRFTDLSTGVIQIKSEAELLSAGNIVSGNV